MKSFVHVLIGSFLLLALVSCNLFSAPDNDTENYLFGTVKDASGNVIEGAEIYINFDGINDLADANHARDPGGFRALLTADNFVRLNWITESETNLQGYRLLRSETNAITSAFAIAPLFPSTNTCNQRLYAFTDEGVELGHSYYYWLEEIQIGGFTMAFGPVFIQITGVAPPYVPVAWALRLYPNPFASYCTINYDIIHNCCVSLTIRNPQVNVIRTLEDDTNSPGYHRITWDGRDDNGLKVCGGVYQLQFAVYALTGDKIYDKSLSLLINDPDITFEPVAHSSASGYQISYKQYFQFGALIKVINDLGYATEDYLIPQEFTISVKKTGYVTATKHVSIADLDSNQQEDIVLQIAK